MWKAVLFLGFFLLTEGQADGCVPKSYGPDKTVCVCNATYCDETPEQDPKVPVDGSFYWYVSSKDGQRLSFSEKQFGQCPISLIPPLTLNVDNSVQYQEILGFGGAFTDSAGINIKKLSEPVQKKLLCTYFCEEGSRYSLGRLPIAGTDFSVKPYTYDDHDNDLTLANFSLASEDYKYKIPYIQKAQKLNPELLMVSAAWSAPAWMKTNDKVNGHGFLKKEYYQLYAEYILKFLEEYDKHGIDVWAVSTGNEPLNAYIPFDRLTTMGWTSGTVSKWVGDNLGPTLAASSHNDTKILLLDDQRIFLPWFIKQVLAHEKANQYADGVAVHFYADILNSPNVLTETHDAFPDKFILMTEASLVILTSVMNDESFRRKEGQRMAYVKERDAESRAGTVQSISHSLFFLASRNFIVHYTRPGLFVKHVDLGAWDRGESYMSSILDYLNNWSVGWIDWNLALDETGGPNWINNNVDSPIIVNATTDEFYKQPMFYALKHFSRFIGRGSTRISITDDFQVKSAAFLTPSNETVVVLFNKWDIPRTVVVNDLNKGELCVQVPARSMHTIIYGN